MGGFANLYRILNDIWDKMIHSIRKVAKETLKE